MAKLKNRRRKEGEICTRRDAIRNHCMECMGYQMAEIRHCTAIACWLYPYRPGATRAEMGAERERAGLKPIEKKTNKVGNPHRFVKKEKIGEETEKTN